MPAPEGLIRVPSDPAQWDLDEGENLPKWDYTTTDGKWRVRRNLHGCGNRDWWQVTKTDTGEPYWLLTAPTLAGTMKFIRAWSKPAAIAEAEDDEAEDDGEMATPPEGLIRIPSNPAQWDPDEKDPPLWDYATPDDDFRVRRNLEVAPEYKSSVSDDCNDDPSDDYWRWQVAIAIPSGRYPCTDTPSGRELYWWLTVPTLESAAEVIRTRRAQIAERREEMRREDIAKTKEHSMNEEDQAAVRPPEESPGAAERAGIARIAEDEIVAGDLLLTRPQAKKLDGQIREAAKDAINSLAVVEDLLAQAKKGEIHRALGYESWTGYIADTFAGSLDLGEAKRKKLIGILSCNGMSMRAIAKTLGMDKSKVHRQLSQSETVERPDNVIGLDGKRHPSKAPRPKPEQPDVVVAEVLTELTTDKPEAAVVAEIGTLAAEAEEPEEFRRFWVLRDQFRSEDGFIRSYVEAVADIGLSNERTGTEWDTPLVAGDLPEVLGKEYSRSNNPEHDDAATARELADMLTAALPRIEELRDLLYARGR